MQQSKQCPKGMTLIELVIALAVMLTLFAVAYPSYQKQLHAGYRIEAQAQLMTLARHLEMHYDLTNPSFTQGYDFSVISAGRCIICAGSSQHYQFSVQSSAGYTLSAVSPLAMTDGCAQLSLTQSGIKQPLQCWK